MDETQTFAVEGNCGWRGRRARCTLGDGQFRRVVDKTSDKLMPKNKFRELQRAAAEAQEATAKVAERVTRPLLGRRLRSSEHERAKPIVHYGFGSVVGALYGASAEYASFVRKFAGAPFGAAVFAGADQLALPALNLTKSPREYPLAMHATEFSSHLFYGMALEGMRRLVRKILRG
jgi:putative membrane protein